MTRVPPHRHQLDEDRGGTTNAPPPPTTTATVRPQGGGAYTSEASFNTSMVVILGALLGTLICAVGLNSIVRCALRCTGHVTGSNRHRPNPTRMVDGFRGLKRSTIMQIPVTIYDHINTNIDLISTDCIICLGEFVGGEKIRVLPKCKHGFHVRCIDTWLLSHSSCPTCRQSVLVSVSVPVWASERPGNGRDLVSAGVAGNGRDSSGNELVVDASYDL